MIPIKILCGCGQKYAFDAEPVGGRMGHLIQCPVCGADGTITANRLIGEQLAALAAPAPGIGIAAHLEPSLPKAPPPPQRTAQASQVHHNSRRDGAKGKWLTASICIATVLILIGAVSL